MVTIDHGHLGGQRSQRKAHAVLTHPAVVVLAQAAE